MWWCRKKKISVKTSRSITVQQSSERSSQLSAVWWTALWLTLVNWIIIIKKKIKKTSASSFYLSQEQKHARKSFSHSDEEISILSTRCLRLQCVWLPCSDRVRLSCCSWGRSLCRCHSDTVHRSETPTNPWDTGGQSYTHTYHQVESVRSWWR